MTCPQCGWAPQRKARFPGRVLKAHITVAHSTRRKRSDAVERGVASRLANERAKSLAQMYLLGKHTGQWADSEYSHLTDTQVIATIFSMLDEAPQPEFHAVRRGHDSSEGFGRMSMEPTRVDTAERNLVSRYLALLVAAVALVLAVIALSVARADNHRVVLSVYNACQTNNRLNATLAAIERTNKRATLYRQVKLANCGKKP